MLSQLENLDKEKEVLRTSLDSVGTRVDRVERELDYLETQNGVQPCVDVDDKLIEQQVTLVQEKQKAKYLRLSGETQPGLSFERFLSKASSCLRYYQSFPVCRLQRHDLQHQSHEDPEAGRRAEGHVDQRHRPGIREGLRL